MTVYDMLDWTEFFNRRLARRILQILLLAALLCPPVSRWLFQQAISRAQQRVMAITQPAMKQLLQPISTAPTQQPLHGRALIGGEISK